MGGEAAAGRPYVWRQDSAPCHISGKSEVAVGELLRHHPEHVASQFTRLLRMGRIVERDINRTSCSTNTQLVEGEEGILRSLQEYYDGGLRQVQEPAGGGGGC